jgi:hypothetical protein
MMRLGEVGIEGLECAVVGFALGLSPPCCGDILLSVVSNTQPDSGAAADGSLSHPPPGWWALGVEEKKEHQLRNDALGWGWD